MDGHDDHHEGEGEGEGEGVGHHGIPHEPPPSVPRRLVPERPMLLRGLALAGLAAGAAFGAYGSIQKAGWLAALTTAPVLAVASILAAWAAAIHLTGGEKYDDHPWV